MYETLVEILTSRFQVQAEQIRPEATLQDLGLDSLFVVELSFVLEGDYGIDIGFEELVKATNVADVVQLMKEKTDAAV